ncbi:MAG: hypothetical protein LQ352_005898 [Teloschistes flavicans]|nr:MAG: hypothetical protein LQ352_005898 [Teloschistes flavicans]
MSSPAASSPLQYSHAEAIKVSQQAGTYLQKNGSTRESTVLPYLSRLESSEQWKTHENLLYSCLRTGDDKNAHLCLERLAGRFGTKNERVMGLRGLYQEAMADSNSAIDQTLHEYEKILAEDNTNTPIKKRRVALLRNLSREAEAIDSLVELLEASPTDIEAWAELSELYVSQGCYQQAEFCLEEILLSTPNAWNMHARLGEIIYIAATASQDQVGSLAESVRRFCRSIELCDGFLRGYYGLKLASDRLLEALAANTSKNNMASSGNSSSELSIPSPEILRRLSQKATLFLAEKTRISNEPRSDTPDMAAVVELLRSTALAQQH